MRKRVSFDYYVLLFFLVSFLGWLWEVGIYLVREGRFVNRGILSGPWLPIYGAGGLFLYLLFSSCLFREERTFSLLSEGPPSKGPPLKGHRFHWKKKPLSVFIISMTICSVLEYLAGFYLEKAWGVRWWDYSGAFWNLDGHVCLMSGLLFGVGGLFLVFGLIPVYTGLYYRIPPKVRLAAELLLLGIFVADAAYSADFPNIGKGITYRAL